MKNELRVTYPLTSDITDDAICKALGRSIGDVGHGMGRRDMWFGYRTTDRAVNAERRLRSVFGSRVQTWIDPGEYA